MNELDRVVLTIDLPEHGLVAGDIGLIVHNYNQGSGYEVEFVALDGRLIALVAVAPQQIRPVATAEIAHVRSVSG